MKFKAEVECTPEEARRFMGLPDLQPMQELLMQEFEARLRANIQALDPETVMKTWLPAGMQGAEQFQKMFWSQMQQGMAGLVGAASAPYTGKSKTGT